MTTATPTTTPIDERGLYFHLIFRNYLGLVRLTEWSKNLLKLNM